MRRSGVDTVNENSAPATARSGTDLLQVKGITTGHGRTVVVRDVSLTVPRSTVVGLLGPNGAGKTTLLRTLSGVIRPAAGSVYFNGVDITKMSVHRRAAMGLCHVPEGRGIFRALSVRDNIIMQSPPGQEAESISRAFEAFPILANRMRQTAGTLSGGEQQMLAIAVVYVRNASLILIDEASLGLAPIVIDAIFESLKVATAGGASLLIVDQFVGRVLELADYVYLLNHGDMVYAGTTTGLDAENLFSRYIGSSA
jgi:branched-chain amino acid transport system ATP-binding protein